jgi:tetratricopeptide (TPR) repeat protein
LNGSARPRSRNGPLRRLRINDRTDPVFAFLAGCQERGVFQILGVVIPISMFILGYFTSSLDKYLDKRNKIRNLEYLFVMELSQNLGHLAMIQPPKEKKESIPPPELVFEMSKTMSYEVFNAYLAQIAELPCEEAQSVFTAYMSLQRYSKAAEEFRNMGPNHPDRKLWRARATVMFLYYENAYKHALEAIKKFPGGQKIADEALKDKGKAFQAYEKANEKIISE